MDAKVIAEIGEIRKMKAAALRIRYRELFGEESRSSNRQFLFRRIAWRLQANAEGGLSERARQRALEIADDADLRVRAPEGFLHNAPAAPQKGPGEERRTLAPGTLLTRQHGNRRIVVTVLADGFEYESRKYQSLSAIAREVTGTRWNGRRFFGLTERSHA